LKEKQRKKLADDYKCQKFNPGKDSSFSNKDIILQRRVNKRRTA
jgi:hypothetical protein